MDPTSSVAVPVVGMHRSGTSMVAQLLEAGGVGFGPEDALAGPDADNRHGFWEHRALREINEQLLSRFGGDWRNPPRIPAGALGDSEHDDLRERARALLHTLSGAAPSWGWKDPRTCLLLPFWLPLLPPDPRVVFCLRHPADVAASLETRNRIPAELAGFLWQEYNACACAALPKAHVLVLSYEAVLRDPQAEALRCAEYLAQAGVELDVAAMVATVDRNLAHEQGGQADFPGWWPGGKELHELLSACASDNATWASVNSQPPPRDLGFVALMADASRMAEALDFRENAYEDRVREERESRQARESAVAELENLRAETKAAHAQREDLERRLRDQTALARQLGVELEDYRTLMDNLHGRLEVRLGRILRRVFQRLPG